MYITLLWQLSSLLLLLLVSACQEKNAVDRQLDNLEELATHDPDSAIIVLAIIDFGMLETYDQKDKYIILDTYINDSKCVTAEYEHRFKDEQITDAINRGKSKGKSSAIAYEVSGLECMRLRNYPAAMSDFIIADKMLAENGDHFRRGKVRMWMSDINAIVYNHKGVVDNMQIAFDEFIAFGDVCSICSVAEKLVVALSKEGDVELAEEILSEVDSVMEVKGCLERRQHMEELRSLVEALKSAEEIATDYSGDMIGCIHSLDDASNFVLPDSLLFTMADCHGIVSGMWGTGERHKAARFLKLLLDRYEKASHMLPSKLSVSAADESTVYIYERPSEIGLMSMFQADVDAEVRKFEYGESLLKQQKIHYQRQVLFMGCAILVLLAFFVAFFVRNRWVRLRRRVDRAKDMVEELNRNFRQVQSEFYKTFSGLCDTYYNICVKTTANSKVLRDALTAIEKFASSPEFFIKIEVYLNENRAMLMSRFRSQMVGLREEEYRLFLCNSLGFSVPTMTILLGEKREVVYNRRLRLRAKIQSQAPVDAEEFLENINK